MSRRAPRLVLAVVIPAVVIAAVALERMTAASAQVGMRRAPARRVPRPAVAPTRKVVIVRPGQGAAADTTGVPADESPRSAPALLSRSELRRAVGTQVGDVWLDLYPRRPSVPNKGHLRWSKARAFVTTAANHPNGYLRFLLRGTGWPTDQPAAWVHVRPQVEGARYLVDCSVQMDDSSAPLTVTCAGRDYVVSPIKGHLVFIWETRRGGDTRSAEWRNYVRISAPDDEWTFYRCQLTFLGGAET